MHMSHASRLVGLARERTRCLSNRRVEWSANDHSPRPPGSIFSPPCLNPPLGGGRRPTSYRDADHGRLRRNSSWTRIVTTTTTTTCSSRRSRRQGRTLPRRVAALRVSHYCEIYLHGSEQGAEWALGKADKQRVELSPGWVGRVIDISTRTNPWIRVLFPPSLQLDEVLLLDPKLTPGTLL